MEKKKRQINDRFLTSRLGIVLLVLFPLCVLVFFFSQSAAKEPDDFANWVKEFRQEAVKLVIEGGLSWAEAARWSSLPTSTLLNWVKVAKAGKLGDVGKKYRPLTEVEMELARTKKELVEVKMERDIL